ncbi:hypothetical protein [Actinomadura formosensis]|uniref:hypothetical protein n=1 Tax=Actinomadura formosensis TaxID=60706 RepID=UPI000835E369|nr:hypothetical protein [Actinomadura formosensis]
MVASFIGFVLLVGVIGSLLWLGVRALRGHSARQAERWALRQEAVQGLRLRDGRDGHLAYVERVYQRARTGAKAIIVWDATGTRQDAWFHDWPGISAGTYLLLVGTTGYGPHNHNPQVYYVRPHQVLTMI